MSRKNWNTIDELLNLIDSSVNKTDFNGDDLVELVSYMIEYYIELNSLTITKSYLLLSDLHYTINVDENIAKLIGLEFIDFRVYSFDFNRKYGDSSLLILKNAVVVDVLVHLNLSSYRYMKDFQSYSYINFDFTVSDSLFLNNDELLNSLLSYNRFSFDTLYDNHFSDDLRRKLFVYLLNNNHIDTYLDMYFFDEFLDDLEHMFPDELVDISNLKGYFINYNSIEPTNIQDEFIPVDRPNNIDISKTSLNLPKIDFRLDVIDNLIMSTHAFVFLEKTSRLIKQHRFAFMKSVTLCMYYNEVIDLVEDFDEIIINNLDNYAKFDIHLFIDGVYGDSPLAKIHHPYLEISEISESYLDDDDSYGVLVEDNDEDDY